MLRSELKRRKLRNDGKPLRATLEQQVRLGRPQPTTVTSGELSEHSRRQ
jgi:hypothetical protein